MTTVASIPLIDLLPPGEWADDRDSETNCVEMLRKGTLCLLVQFPAAPFSDILRARMGMEEGKDPTYAHWAMLRMALQDAAWRYIESLTLPHMGGTTRWLTRLGEAGERPDMRNLFDAAISDAVAAKDAETMEGLGDVLAQDEEP